MLDIRQRTATTRPVTSLGHQEGRRLFREGPKFFELRPIVLKYVQYIFPGGAKNFLRWVSPALRPPLLTGLATTRKRKIVKEALQLRYERRRQMQSYPSQTESSLYLAHFSNQQALSLQLNGHDGLCKE